MTSGGVEDLRVSSGPQAAGVMTTYEPGGRVTAAPKGR